jgi:hypothetical protein
LLHPVERPASIKEPLVAFDVSPGGSNASITVSSKASDSNRSDTGKDTIWIPWIPVVVPLLALLPALAAYIIGWGAVAGTH